jgi:hypothetical protein
MLWSFWLTVTLSLCWVISSKRGKERSLLKIPGFELVDKAQFKLQNETDDPSLVLFHSYSSPSSTPAFKFFKELPSKMEKQMPFVKLRAFDCIGAVEVCAELNIPKYPTAVLFANKNKYRYDGRYSWKPFANWMKELLIISSREVRNMYEFNFFIKRFTNSEKKPVIFFCGSSSHVGFKSFEELSKNRKSEQYLFSEDPSVMQKFNCTSGDTLFLKSTGEVKKNQHHSNKPYSLERFVLSNEYPNVSLLSLYHYRDFFDDSKAMLLVLDSHQDENMLELLDKVSALHKSSMSVYYLYPHDHNKALVRKVESLLGTAYDDYPCVRYIKLQDQKLKKFKMTGNISSRKINLFLKAIQKGKIAPYLRSQPQKVHHKHFKVRVSHLEISGNELRALLQEPLLHILYSPFQELRQLPQMQRGSLA